VALAEAPEAIAATLSSTTRLDSTRPNPVFPLPIFRTIYHAHLNPINIPSNHPPDLDISLPIHLSSNGSNKWHGRSVSTVSRPIEPERIPSQTRSNDCS
jgi:hypothetical protein